MCLTALILAMQIANGQQTDSVTTVDVPDIYVGESLFHVDDSTKPRLHIGHPGQPADTTPSGRPVYAPGSANVTPKAVRKHLGVPVAQPGEWAVMGGLAVPAVWGIAMPQIISDDCTWLGRNTCSQEERSRAILPAVVGAVSVSVLVGYALSVRARRTRRLRSRALEYNDTLLRDMPPSTARAAYPGILMSDDTPGS